MCVGGERSAKEMELRCCIVVRIYYICATIFLANVQYNSFNLYYCEATMIVTTESNKNSGIKLSRMNF